MQVNTRLKALDEMYQICIPLHLSDINKVTIQQIFVTNFGDYYFVHKFSNNIICQFFAIFVTSCAETSLIIDHQENVGKKRENGKA